MSTTQAGPGPAGQLGRSWEEVGRDLLHLISVQLHISERRVPLVSEAHPLPAVSQSLLT